MTFEDERCHIVDEADSTPKKKAGTTAQLIRHIATLYQKDYFSVELNIVQFFDNPPAYDIRRWWRFENGHEKAGRHGIQLTEQQARALKDALNTEFKED